MEGKLRFKIDWASLIFVEGNLPFFLCFTLYLRPISKYKPLGAGKAYFLRGDLTEGFCVTSLGAYFWNFLVCHCFGEVSH